VFSVKYKICYNNQENIGAYSTKEYPSGVSPLSIFILIYAECLSSALAHAEEIPRIEGVRVYKCTLSFSVIIGW
jgi:hypothetical protein